MRNLKYLLLFVCIAGCLAACKKNDFDQEKQFKADTTAIRKFITDNNIPAVKDPSGLFYQIIQPGSGSVNYTATTSITSNYTGRLLNGTVFDSSKGTPITFQLGGVIAGWQIGITKIQKGGKIRLIVPSLLGYGNQATGPIEENSILDFDVELTDVK